MASWNNNYITVPKWNGSGINANSNVLTVSSLNANSISTSYLHAASLSTNNGSIAFLSNLVLNTGVIGLGIGPTFLTAEAGVLYVNGDAVAFPSSFSTIADWSQFKAVANVNMSRSSIYNVQSISTNIISTGFIVASNISNRSLSTVNISSANITFDTLNGGSGTIRTLSGSNLVYSNSFFSNATASNIYASNIITHNIVASNDLTVPSISTILISSFLVEADTLASRGLVTSNAEIKTKLFVRDIELYTAFFPIYNSNTVYSPTDKVIYNASVYEAVVSNLNVLPGSNIVGWVNNSSYLVNNYTFVEGVGAYRCISNISGSFTTPNGDLTHWTYFSNNNSGSQIWTDLGELSDIKAGIIGNINSYISVGTIVASNLNISTLIGRTLTASNINVSTININNISSSVATLSNLTTYNINNSNNITNGGSISNAGNLSNAGNFSNAGQTNLNTLVTSGQVYTQNILNVQGLMSLQSDTFGQTEDVTLLIPPFTTTPKYLRDIRNIKVGQFERIDVFGGSTGNRLGPPYRRNSIVNIGTSEICPGIVTIGGVNILENTNALTVNGAMAVQFGSFTSYYSASFYPFNVTANAINVYGLSYLNGGTTITGLLNCLGAVTIAGVTTVTGDINTFGLNTFTGETNILGALTAEAGIGIVGVTTIQGGDIIIGNSGGGPTNNFNLYCYYNNTDIENLTVNGNADFRQNVNIDGNLTANNISLSSTNTRYANVSTLFVSTLIGNIGQFNSISTNSLSTSAIVSSNINTTNITATTLFTQNIGSLFTSPIRMNNSLNLQDNNIINVNSLTTSNVSTVSISTNQVVARNGLFNGISTINISTNQVVARNGLFNNLTASSISTINISTNSITSDSLSTNTILTSNISTNTLNMITGTGNVLSLKSYEGLDPILAIERTIDGIDTPEGGFGSVNDLGLVLVGFSTLTIQASDDIKIETGQNIRLSPQENVIVSASNLIVNRNANISSINTNFISTFNINATYVDLYSQDSNLDPAIVFSRNIEGEKFNDAGITTNNTNGFQISAASTMSIISYDDMLIRSINGNIGILSDSNNIIISAPETIIPYNLNVSSISTGYVIAGSVIATNGIGTVNVTTSNLNTVYASTGSVYADRATIVNDLSANNLFTNSLYTIFLGNPLPYQAPITFNANLNISGNDIYNTASLSASNISTNFLSTGSLFVNNSVENSISSLRISSGSLFSGAVSTLQLNTSSIRANRAFIDRLNPLIDSGTATANLYPQSAGSQIGFFGSGGTNSGGFYNNINIRSTITQVIVPDIVGAFSNNIRVQGNLSTQNVFVSSINNKVYPYTSTLNIPFSSFSITGNQAGTPILLYSNIDFRTQGFHRISQKAILSKNSGGTSADIHGNIFYSRGSFPSTPSITDGYSALPSVNQDNASTFTTLMTELYVSTPTTRSIFYYDSTANNYTARLYMGTLFDSVTPDFGNNSTRIPNIQ